METALAVLRAGGVVAAPTETFYGLLADAMNPGALGALFRLKPRASASALLVPDRTAWARLVAELPSTALALADAFWPGPLTVALPTAADVDRRLVMDGTVGVRVPGPSVAAELCSGYGKALTATSANLTGAPPAKTGEEVRRAFADAVSCGRLHVVDGTCPGGLPSTIVVIRGSSVAVAREGAVSRAEVEAALGRRL